MKGIEVFIRLSIGIKHRINMSSKTHATIFRNTMMKLANHVPELQHELGLDAERLLKVA